MTDPTGPEEFADVNEAVGTDWEAETTLYERVRETISGFEAEYSVESSEELVIDRTNQALSEAVSDHERLDSDAIREWQTTRRNLALANAALSIANAKRFVDGESRSPDESAPVQ